VHWEAPIRKEDRAFWTQAHSRELLQPLRCQLPFSGLGSEINEYPMQTIPHRRTISESLKSSLDEYLEPCGRTIDLKRFADLHPVCRSFLDGCHSDLEFTITLEISRPAAAENPRFHRAQGSHRPHIDRRQSQGSNVAMHSKGDLLWRNK
jgi:hypothetical protein